MAGWRNIRGIWSEFEAGFATEQACREYLFAAEIAGGVSLPALQRSIPLLAGAVGADAMSAVWSPDLGNGAGTIFQDTRKPLVDWFRAMYWLASQKNGASTPWACRGCWDWADYKTAWTWLHKLCGGRWYDRGVTG